MYCWRWSRTDDPVADMQPNTIVSINVKFMLIQNVNKGRKKKENSTWCCNVILENSPYACLGYRRANLTTMYRFEIVKLWSFAQMNSQGSTVKKNTRAHRVSISHFHVSHNAPPFRPQNFAQALFSISLRMDVIPRRNEKQRLCKILGGKLGALWQMWKWRLRATNYACKRGLVVRFSPLKDLAWTGEYGKFLLVESGIQNPGLWNPEYSSKKKIPLKSWMQMQAPLTKNLGSRIHSVKSKNQDCLGFLNMDRDQWRIQGRRAPPYFLAKLRPEGPKKKFFLRSPLPLSQSLDDRPPPLDPPLETSVARRAC